MKTSTPPYFIPALGLDIGRACAKVAVDNHTSHDGTPTLVGAIDSKPYWTPVLRPDPQKLPPPSTQMHRSGFQGGEINCIVSPSNYIWDPTQKLWHEDNFTELFKAAFRLLRDELLKLNDDQPHVSVGRIVVGLPVTHSRDQKIRIPGYLLGTHELGFGKDGQRLSVEVRAVTLMPSIQGSANVLADQTPDKQLSNALVLDLGPHGLDALITYEGHASTEAFGTFEHGLTLRYSEEPTELTSAKSATSMMKTEGSSEYVESPADELTATELSELHSKWLKDSLKNLSGVLPPIKEFNQIVVTGGHWYKLASALVEIFPGIDHRVIVANCPQTANARGLLAVAKAMPPLSNVIG